LQTKQELEAIPLTRLAAMCGKVADDVSTFGAQLSDKAQALRTEWVSLAASETPQSSDYKTHQQVQAKKAALKTRMVGFLFGV
jgi:hypothetical protein